jgi:hypothetical protein
VSGPNRASANDKIDPANRGALNTTDARRNPVRMLMAQLGLLWSGATQRKLDEHITFKPSDTSPNWT